MIVDTSAVIEFLRGTGSPAHMALRRALRDKTPLWMPAVVLQEVLQGARSASHFIRLQTELETLPLFEPEDLTSLHQQAAMLYARCRWQGWTVRSPNDCLVAACALEAQAPLLARDSDFAAIARVAPALKLIH